MVEPTADASDPGLVWVFHGVPAGSRGRRVVADGAHLETRRDAESVAALGARRAVLGNRHMILRLTSKTAALVGETPAEWDLLEKQVRERLLRGIECGIGHASSVRGGLPLIAMFTRSNLVS
jgi:hypothetical protein